MASICLRTAAIVILSFAVLSAVALAFVVSRTIRLLTALFLKHDNMTAWKPDVLFFRTRLGHYAACLILGNIFLTISRLIDFGGLSNSGLSVGSLCTAQAVLLQIGTWSVSWFTAAHGVHTLCSLVFRIPHTRWRTAANIIVGWTSALIVGVAPLQQRGVYGPIRGSCTIKISLPVERFALQLFPIILGAIVSTTVYSIVFIVLHGKLSVNKTRKLRRLGMGRQREEYILQEYHQFIFTIIWTMFWFPLAFLLLFLPFCITQLLLVSGISVPAVACVFADACVALLGLVNVGLLCNTFRVIKHVYSGSHTAKVLETVETFGHTASSESLIPPPRTYDYKRPSLNYPARYRIDLNPQRNRIDKAFIRSKPLPPLPPAEISRRFRGGPVNVLPLNIVKKKDNKVPITIDLASSPAHLGPCTPHAASVSEDGRHNPSTRDEECSSQRMAPVDTSVSETTEKKESFKSKALPELRHSRASSDPPFLLRHVSIKSAAFASRLGTPVSVPSPTSTIHSCQRLDKGKARVSVTRDADGSKFRPDSFFCSTSTGTLSADSDSDYSVKIIQARKVRPLPSLPEPGNNGDGAPISCAPTVRDHDNDNASDCMSMATVRSQGSSEMRGRSVDVKKREVDPELASDMLILGVVPGEQVVVGQMLEESSPSC